MSLKKIKQVKADKGFKIWDIIIYAAIILIAVALIISYFATRDTSPLTAVTVYYKGDAVFCYDFEEDEYEVLNADHIINIADDENELSLRFVVSSDTPESDYNDIYINKTDVSVTVTDADCSTRKDCYYMDDITDSSKEIICTPHYMTIKPSGYTVSGSDITVG